MGTGFNSAGLNSATSAGLLGSMMTGWLIGLVVFVLMIVAFWKLFTKAGKPGWTGIIPILNTLQLLDIAGKPWWWLLLMMIPIVDIVLWFLIAISFARAYGKGAGFGIGLALLPPIFYLILAFGSAQYQRPADYPPTWLNI